MHGVVFASLRDYLIAEHGSDAAEAVFDGEPAYLLTEAYDDERLASLIDRAARRAGADVDEVVHEFGVFTAQRTFARLYPEFFSIAGSARDFLLSVETHIHELVRATVPNARPPQLSISDEGEDRVSIVYTSPRHLCVLLRGLTEGTARYYGETASIEETECMRRGDAACRFRVELRSAGGSEATPATASPTV